MDLKSSFPAGRASKQLGVMFLLLAFIITCLFGLTWLPSHTLFSNDGPLARLVSQCHHLPEAFSGVWEDLNTIGYREQGALPNITYGLRLVAGPVLFSKFYVPLALMVLGLGAWSFFRQCGLSPAACVLGGLAAMLNSDFFSTACWGIAANPLVVGMSYFALAALMRTTAWRGWARAMLAGFAVGMGLAEGADVGAIFSLYVAAFVIYQAWIADGPRVKNLVMGVGRVSVVAIFAAFLAAQAIFALVNTQIEGVHGMEQDTQTRESRWAWATQWSLPKNETLSLVVPGLFGYRMDTTDGGNYWGSIGRDVAWDKYFAGGQQGTAPRTLIRQTGSGLYAGVAVVLLAVWAAVQSFRKKNSVFNLTQRRWLWFWIVVAFISLLFGYGHHAPFYRMLYALPYFSTIRNPIKFLSIVNFALVILFAYGVDGLWRTYLERVRVGQPRPSANQGRFNRIWIYSCLGVLALSLVGWGIYYNSRAALIENLLNTQFAETKAHVTADFSIAQVGWFVLFFIIAAGLMAAILRGMFANNGGWAVALLGLLVVVDLGRANLPWIIDWNYEEKYASNPVIDLLRDKPYEHRVALEPFRAAAAHGLLDELYHYEWAQQHFQYYNIESLDIVQLPRTPQDLLNFQHATQFDGTIASAPKIVRRWELTNTRYLMGAAEYIRAYNEQFDPVKKRVRIAARFKIVPRPNATSPRRLERVTAQFAPDGDYAIFEFTGGLPRAKLYSNWQINTNNEAILPLLIAPSFDVTHSIFVNGGLPAGVGSPDTNENTGTVDFASYASKDIVLNAHAANNSVLLLNDRYDSNWKVFVDGKSAPLLKCNYLMRGVYLEPGDHKVEFRFLPPVGALYVSLAALGAALVLIGIVLMPQSQSKKAPEKNQSAPSASTPTVPRPQPVIAVASQTSPKPGKQKRAGAKSKR
ncbi:MAG TPA: YfhO family protein [Verrucomicrobiae bacterium]|nr:YfhO family protein [Verrucomicrobiae bacterium]